MCKGIQTVFALLILTTALISSDILAATNVVSTASKPRAATVEPISISVVVEPVNPTEMLNIDVEVEPAKPTEQTTIDADVIQCVESSSITNFIIETISSIAQTQLTRVEIKKIAALASTGKYTIDDVNRLIAEGGSKWGTTAYHLLRAANKETDPNRKQALINAAYLMVVEDEERKFAEETSGEKKEDDGVF